MIVDRRPYYLAGALIGIGLIALLLLAPKVTPEERVAEDVAVLAMEPWDQVEVERVEIEGPRDAPHGARLYGHRPDGRPVLVQFVATSPYSSPTAIRRLSAAEIEGRTADVLMVPRPLVNKKFIDRYDAQATHAGIAFYVAAEPVAADTLDTGAMEPVSAAHAPEG